MEATKEKRSQQRCEKAVGMRCAVLNNDVNAPATLRNFSGSGVFFETAVRIPPGTFIVLRSADAGDSGDVTESRYSLETGDPEACSLFRSHTVARVRRCERLAGRDDSPRYGVAAEIQRL